MAFSESLLKSDILAAFEELQKVTTNPSSAHSRLADKLAKAIIKQLRLADVNTNVNTIIAPAGASVLAAPGAVAIVTSGGPGSNPLPVSSTNATPIKTTGTGTGKLS